MSFTPSERVTQNRIVALLRNELKFTYLGNWADRPGNSNVEDERMTAHLLKAKYPPDLISRALFAFKTEAHHPQRSLYENNKAVYQLLRYGVPVKPDVGENTQTVHLIDWVHPENNDFAVAEEVTLMGNHERRPDLVVYVNGVALAVIELKNSRVSLGDGIRQNLSNQRPEFNSWFFSTVQFLFAGNDSEGLRYGTVGTEEKEWLTWKEDEADNARLKVDKYLLKMLNPRRLLELVHDFVVFDGGVKKVPRVHQYFGIQAAQGRVMARQGGILWHTQGSGKSLVMVLLAQWILENSPHARVVVVTDRVELDTQIGRVFDDAGKKVRQARSGRDLISALGQGEHRLICSLVHKFGRKDVEDFDQFLDDLARQPSPAVGEVFVFVDECHRTQSGRLHKVMKALLPQAVFIGFTGTPLLKKDKATSLEVFGTYIHTYLYGEAVQDSVVLDLVYEARDIDQLLKSQDRIDAWFDAKTRGLNAWQREELKREWGTMQRVLSSRSRMEQVVDDILMDFATKPRLVSGRGNALLVSHSIYEAARYFTLFQKTSFQGH